MKSRLYLRLLLLIAISFATVSLLIYFTGRPEVWWSLYLLPVLLSAYAYGVTGGSVVALAGVAAALGLASVPAWSYRVPPELLSQLVTGGAVLTTGGVAFGWISRSQRELERRADEVSIHDELTHAHSRNYFEDRLDEEISRAGRYDMPLAVLAVDVDGLKGFNRTFGRVKGDLLLARLAKILQGCVRDIDIVARYGGEEFLVLLPNVRRDAEIIAERIRRTVAETEFEGDEVDPAVKATVSVGVAYYPADAIDGRELVAKSEKAVARAKGLGRNKVAM